MTPSIPKLSVVIPTFNRRDLLLQTLPRVLGQACERATYEVIVVVDGSTDGTAEALRGMASGPSMRVIEQENRGPAAARNAGIAVARGELVLFLDDDIVCEPSLVARHIEAHTGADAQLLVFGPVFVSPQSPSTIAVDWMRESARLYYSRFVQGATLPRREMAHVLPNSSVARAALERCGGFDTGFRNAREDADLAFRLWDRGIRFRYRADLVTHHLYTKKSRDVIGIDAASDARSEIALCRKHPQYRSHSPLSRFAQGSLARRMVRGLAVRSPVPIDPMLATVQAVAQAFRRFTWARRLGVRALRARWSLALFRQAMRSCGSWAAFRGEFGQRLPVLLYHHVGPTVAGTFPNLTVSPSRFASHIRLLSRLGFVGITATDWARWSLEGRRLPPKPILITFDDAYGDIGVHAFPCLERHGFRATVYAVAGEIGGINRWDVEAGSAAHRLMEADQMRSWSDRGMEFGSHGSEHASLIQLDPDALEREIDGSKRILEAAIGGAVRSFAYPYGHCDAESANAVRRHYDLAFSTEEGINTLRDDLCRLKRGLVQPNESPAGVAFRAFLGWNPLLRARTWIALRRKRSVRALGALRAFSK